MRNWVLRSYVLLAFSFTPSESRFLSPLWLKRQTSWILTQLSETILPQHVEFKGNEYSSAHRFSVILSHETEHLDEEKKKPTSVVIPSGTQATHVGAGLGCTLSVFIN